MNSFAKVLFSTYLLGSFRVNCAINMENDFRVILAVVYVCIKVKPLKKCMYVLY